MIIQADAVSMTHTHIQKKSQGYSNAALNVVVQENISGRPDPACSGLSDGYIMAFLQQILRHK